MTSPSDFDRLARRVYLGARDDAVDREAAFDLACMVLEDEPLNETAAELARLSMDDTAGARARLAAVALQVSAECFEPGFDEEPGWLTALQHAMDVVNRDMRACGLPGTGRLVVPEWSPNAFAQSWDNDSSTSSGIYPISGSDPVSALVAVADDAQDAVMHTIWEPHLLDRAAGWPCQAAARSRGPCHGHPESAAPISRRQPHQRRQL